MTDRAPTSIPGTDPLDAGSRWLDLHEDDECSIHPIHRSTVTGLHAAAATARMFASEYKRERDEALGRCRAVAVLLREMSNRTPVPPAARLRQLADRLAGEDA